MRRDPRVAMLMDPDNPYRYLEIRGKVTDITQDGADSQIDKMAKKYLGKDKYLFGQPGEQRAVHHRAGKDPHHGIREKQPRIYRSHASEK